MLQINRNRPLQQRNILALSGTQTFNFDNNKRSSVLASQPNPATQPAQFQPPSSTRKTPNSLIEMTKTIAKSTPETVLRGSTKLRQKLSKPFSQTTAQLQTDTDHQIRFPTDSQSPTNQHQHPNQKHGTDQHENSNSQPFRQLTTQNTTQAQHRLSRDPKGGRKDLLSYFKSAGT